MKSNYDKGQRLFNIATCKPYTFYYADKYGVGRFYEGKENTNVRYNGIYDNGDRAESYSHTTRAIRTDGKGEYYIVHGKRIYITFEDERFLYHGSNVKITKFVDKYIGTENSNDEDGPGIYLTDDVTEARRYGKYVYVIKLNSTKVLPHTGFISYQRAVKFLQKAPRYELMLTNWTENQADALKEVMFSMEEQRKNNPFEFFQQAWIDFYRYDEVQWARNMVQFGYDYGIADKGVHKHYMVYNSKIISIIRVKNNN